jgi:heparanase
MTKALRFALAGVAATVISAAASTTGTMHPPDKMPRIAIIDERYQSYNVEMAELTGGAFWKPYEQLAADSASPRAGSAPRPGGAEFYASLKTPMPPIDLSNPRLRKLAAALGPAYVRSSGNAADAVYFHDSDSPAPATPPDGYESVLTRAQWKGLIDFANVVNARIVTSFAVSGGTRDASGRWSAEQARRLVEYTKSVGGDIAAAEFFNEPTLGPQGIGGLPKGYDSAAFARDFVVFRQFQRSTAPNMLVLGPSATGEGPVTLLSGELIRTQDIFTATPRPVFDGFSYHMYGASSIRCEAPGKLTTTEDVSLAEEWLSRGEQTYEYYAGLRDRFLAGKAMWLTETGETSCGGNPWAKTFRDSFRYLDQLGRLAKHGVHTVMHNTLAVSEYALLDRQTLEPRPNYWAALLWRRLMGTTVLDAGVPRIEGLHLYAHCLPGQGGGITLLAINNSRSRSEFIELAVGAERYTLSAQRVDGDQIQLNGRALNLDANGELPALRGETAPPGRIDFAPTTITFLAVPDARNASCRT